MGNCIWNVAPLPTIDSTQIRPPCISTICLAMARPSPVPPLALVLELSTCRNFSKMRSLVRRNAGAGIRHATAKWPFWLAVMRTSPVSVNLMALPTRLSSTWVRRCSSPKPEGSAWQRRS